MQIAVAEGGLGAERIFSHLLLFRDSPTVQTPGKQEMVCKGARISFDLLPNHQPRHKSVIAARAKTAGFLAALVFACLGVSASAFTFTPGHIYTTNDFSLNIMEYDSAGNFVDSLTLPSTLGSETRGIAFGPDGLLYVTILHKHGFAVYALDSTGAVHETYRAAGVYAGGNISYGKIAVDQNYIYVAAQTQLTRFRVGSPRSRATIYTNPNSVFDVKLLPSGNLFVAYYYGIDEITSDGALVRHITLSGGPSFVDVRGVEYDPLTDKLFVTEFGSGTFIFQLMRINASTGEFEASTQFSYGDDIFLSQSGTLLVGSRTETPRIYGEDLTQIGTIGTVQRMFVTQYNPP